MRVTEGRRASGPGPWASAVSDPPSRRLLIVLSAAAIALLGMPVLSQAQETDPNGPNASTAAEPSASLPDIEDEVMCPICGTALNLSESPQAERERAFIRRLISEGQSKDEIKNALVLEYGPDVLAIPDTRGFDLTAWIIPGVGIAAGVLGLGFGISRWRRSARRAAAAGEAPAPLEAADETRLDSDLARYDL